MVETLFVQATSAISLHISHILFSVGFAADAVFFTLVPLMPLLLNKVNRLNESRPLEQLLGVQYYVDQQKYYTPIYIHGAQAALIVIFIISTVDIYFMMITQHGSSMFVVLG